ncbi:hypothetical protein SAMN04487949_2530 [Halogranum gelatinilyticum]|uniref:DUF5658 domain-containing protein n=1 Tax=Halogranum gelatinilyticum TaxID=660521 RepID=A0A1G9VW30_9EURY|nr:hypothetical protein [Halogranum gelatinilyticum]SDM76390.1 hypothetical protein SAMN04487949_2530 [Halogranum gelatinilyticum]
MSDTWLSLRETPFDDEEFVTLWVLATTTYGVGDIVTTIALIYFSPTVTEGNVVVATAVGAFGQAGLVGLKLGAFLICLVVSVDAAHDGSRSWYYLPPVGLTLLGTTVTVYNIQLMLM